MWLLTDQSFTRNAERPHTDTRRMSMDQRKGIYQSYPPGPLHSIQISPLMQTLQEETGNFLQSKERLACIFNKPPLVAYRRPTSVRDGLVSTKFKTVNNTPLPKGCKACGKPKCGWCKRINKTTTFTSSNENSLKYFTL